MFHLESAIVEWRSQMLAADIRSPVPLAELETHLREEIERQMRSGAGAQQAFEVAVRLMGQTGALKDEFAKEQQQRRDLLRKYSFQAVGVGLSLFIAGVVFCYFVMVPLALGASRIYAGWLGFQVHSLSATTYLGFVCRFMLGMGCAFAIPAILLFLVKIGAANREKLAGFRRHAIVFNLILGALLTTPELFTQLLAFIMLQLFYEVTVYISGHWERKEGQHV